MDDKKDNNDKLSEVISRALVGSDIGLNVQQSKYTFSLADGTSIMLTQDELDAMGDKAMDYIYNRLQARAKGMQGFIRMSGINGNEARKSDQHETF